MKLQIADNEGREEYQFPAGPVGGGSSNPHKGSLRLQNLTNQVGKRFSHLKHFLSRKKLISRGWEEKMFEENFREVCWAAALLVRQNLYET